jgi:hypothetical protein
VDWDRIPAHRTALYIQTRSMTTLRGQYITAVNLSPGHSLERTHDTEHTLKFLGSAEISTEIPLTLSLEHNRKYVGILC